MMELSDLSPVKIDPADDAVVTKKATKNRNDFRAKRLSVHHKCKYPDAESPKKSGRKPSPTKTLKPFLKDAKAHILSHLNRERPPVPQGKQQFHMAARKAAITGGISISSNKADRCNSDKG
jgi:hypothetical protein